MMIPRQSTGVSRTVAVARVSDAGLAPQFFGKLFRKAGKAVGPVAKGPLRMLAEGAHNQFGDLPMTAARMVPVALAGTAHAVFYNYDPSIEGNPLGTGAGFAAGGDEDPCGTCADGSVMWCDEAGNSCGCWD